jgi:hypothetical protein
MGPCTFLVTAVVTGDKNMSVVKKAAEVWHAKGIKVRPLVRPRQRRVSRGSPSCDGMGWGCQGFYPGGTAIAFRQATNWASRQVRPWLVVSDLACVWAEDDAPVGWWPGLH